MNDLITEIILISTCLQAGLLGQEGIVAVFIVESSSKMSFSGAGVGAQQVKLLLAWAAHVPNRC